MTITPTAALPGPSVAAPGEDGPANDAAGRSGDFLAAILDALAGGTAPVPGVPPGAVPGAVPGGPAVAQGSVEITGPAVTTAVAATTTLSATVAPGTLPATATPPPANTAPGLPATTGPSAAAETTPRPPDVPPGVSVVGVVAAGAAPPASGTTPVPAASPGPASAKATPATAPAPPAGSVHGAVVAEHTHDTGRSEAGSAGQHGAAEHTPAPEALTEPATAPVPATTPMTATAPTTAPTTGDTAPDTVAGSVRTQVFTEVTSLVSRGDGVHRVAMTLNPESLGEVRVVMIMRAGVVRVHLTASDGDAKAALAHGSPELVRLLETAGAGDTRIVVRDLPPGSASTDGPTPQFTAGGNRHHTGEHAGTREHHPATDGTNDTTPRRGAGADLPRSIEPVSDTRASGVDVTV